jgi:hypothetical protein
MPPVKLVEDYLLKQVLFPNHTMDVTAFVYRKFASLLISKDDSENDASWDNAAMLMCHTPATHNTKSYALADSDVVGAQIWSISLVGRK